MSDNHKKFTKNVPAYVDGSKNSLPQKKALDQNACGKPWSGYTN